MTKRVYQGSTQVDVKAYKTKVVDASGAGDAFNAGYITGCLHDFDVLDCVGLGNAVASFIIEKWGCQTNIPTWDEVLKRHEEIK